MIAAHGNAGRMDLREAGIGKRGSSFVGAISRGHVATNRIGRKKKNVPVTTGREDYRISGVRRNLPGD